MSVVSQGSRLEAQRLFRASSAHASWRVARSGARRGSAGRGAALLAAGAMALGAGYVLLPREDERAEQAERGAEAPDAGSERASQPELPAPSDRGSREGASDLPPLAREWRAAVLEGRREGVASGVRALRRAKDGKEQLLQLTRDDAGRVRAYALRELGRRRDPSLAATFRGALTDRSPHVRENAQWALDELAAKERAK